MCVYVHVQVYVRIMTRAHDDIIVLHVKKKMMSSCALDYDCACVHVVCVWVCNVVGRSQPCNTARGGRTTEHTQPHRRCTGNRSLVLRTSREFHPTMETPLKTQERMTITLSCFGTPQIKNVLTAEAMIEEAVCGVWWGVWWGVWRGICVVCVGVTLAV